MFYLKDQDFQSGLAFVILSIAGFFYSVVYIDSVSRVGVPADFYPKLLFVILGLCGLRLMYVGYKRAEKVPFPKMDWKMVLITFALLLGYAFLMELAGFVISSIVFMLLFMLVLGERKPVTLVGVPVIGTLAVYFLFTKAFMIVLP